MSNTYFYPDSSSRILPWETLIDAGADPADVHFVRHWGSEHGEETDVCKFMVTKATECSLDEDIYVISVNGEKWIWAFDLQTLANRLKISVDSRKFQVCHDPDFHWGAYTVKLSTPTPTLSDKISNVLAKIIIGLYVGGYLIVCIFIIAAVVLFCYLLS